MPPGVGTGLAKGKPAVCFVRGRGSLFDPCAFTLPRSAHAARSLAAPPTIPAQTFFKIIGCDAHGRMALGPAATSPPCIGRLGPIQKGTPVKEDPHPHLGEEKPSCTDSGQASASPARAPEDPGDRARQVREANITLPSRARARPRA